MERLEAVNLPSMEKTKILGLDYSLQVNEKRKIDDVSSEQLFGRCNERATRGPS